MRIPRRTITRGFGFPSGIGKKQARLRADFADRFGAARLRLRADFADRFGATSPPSR